MAVKNNPNIIPAKNGILLKQPQLGNNIYEVIGKYPNKTDNVHLGPNNKKGVSLDNKESVKITDTGIEVLSNQKILGGISPSQLLQRGMPFNTAFALQENYKDKHKLNDDGSHYKKGGFKRDDKSSFGDKYYDIVKTRRNNIMSALGRAGLDTDSINRLSPFILKQQILEGGWRLNRADNNFGGMRENGVVIPFDSEADFQDAYIKMLDERWHRGKADSLSWRNATDLNDWARILNREDLKLNTKEEWEKYNKGRKGNDFIYLYAPQWENGTKPYSQKLRGVSDRTDFYTNLIVNDDQIGPRKPDGSFKFGGKSDDEFFDTIEPAIVTAKLPAKFHGSQAAAARYAEGYKFGQKVAKQRDKIAPYVLSAAALPLTIDSIATAPFASLVSAAGSAVGKKYGEKIGGSRGANIGSAIGGILGAFSGVTAPNIAKSLMKYGNGVLDRTAEAIVRIGDNAGIPSYLYKQFNNKNTFKYIFDPRKKELAYKLPYNYSGNSSNYFYDEAVPGDIVDQFFGKTKVPNATYDLSVLPESMQKYIAKNYSNKKIPIRDLGEVNRFVIDEDKKAFKKLINEDNVLVGGHSAGLAKNGKYVLDPGGFNAYVSKDPSTIHYNKNGTISGGVFNVNGVDIWKFKPSDYVEHHGGKSNITPLKQIGLKFIDSRGTPIVHTFKGRAFANLGTYKYGGKINKQPLGEKPNVKNEQEMNKRYKKVYGGHLRTLAEINDAKTRLGNYYDTFYNADGSVKKVMPEFDDLLGTTLSADDQTMYRQIWGDDFYNKNVDFNGKVVGAKYNNADKVPSLSKIGTNLLNNNQEIIHNQTLTRPNTINTKRVPSGRFFDGVSNFIKKMDVTPSDLITAAGNIGGLVYSYNKNKKMIDEQQPVRDEILLKHAYKRNTDYNIDPIVSGVRNILAGLRQEINATTASSRNRYGRTLGLAKDMQDTLTKAYATKENVENDRINAEITNKENIANANVETIMNTVNKRRTADITNKNMQSQLYAEAGNNFVNGLAATGNQLIKASEERRKQANDLFIATLPFINEFNSLTEDEFVKKHGSKIYNAVKKGQLIV